MISNLDRALGVLALVGILLLVGPWLLDGDGADRFRRLPELPSDESTAAAAGPASPSTTASGPALMQLERAVKTPALASDDPDTQPHADAPRERLLDASTRARLTADLERAAAAIAARPVDGHLDSDTQADPFGWVVQVGSFSAGDNARRLRARLRAAGHDAWFAADADSSMIRVNVGPVIARADANALAERLRDEFSLDTLLVPFSASMLEAPGERAGREE